MQERNRVLSGQIKRQRGWLSGLALVVGLSLVVVWAPGAQADVKTGDRPVALAAVAPQHQIFNDDLVVAAGERYDGDVVVYNGDVTVENEGHIDGSLIVYSGEIEIEQGGKISGDVTAVSGDVQIDGRVDGSVAVLSGDVQLGDTASIGGDISVVSGKVEQDRGASVGGSLLRGPALNIQIPPIIAPGAVPGVEVRPAMPPFSASRPVSLGERLLAFFGRIMTALGGLILVVGGAVLVAAMRPQMTADVRTVLQRQPALSFAVGLLVNLVAVALIGFMFITICLAPPAALLGLALLGANIVGLSATGELVTDRLGIRVGNAPSVRTALGVAIPGALIAGLWLLGGCFSFFGYIFAMLMASFGMGAVLVKLLKLGDHPPQTTAAIPAMTEDVAAPAADR